MTSSSCDTSPVDCCSFSICRTQSLEEELGRVGERSLGWTHCRAATMTFFSMLTRRGRELRDRWDKILRWRHTKIHCTNYNASRRETALSVSRDTWSASRKTSRGVRREVLRGFTKSSWGSGGRCEPPSGVRGGAPEDFEISAFQRLRTTVSLSFSCQTGKDCFLTWPHGLTVWKVAERRGSNPQPFAPSFCTTCKKAQGSIAVQALELPNENQTRIRTPCTKLAFPVWHFFFKFKFELRGKTVSKENTNGKIPVSNSRAGYPKIAQPVTCETRKCSTASDGEVL